MKKGLLGAVSVIALGGAGVWYYAGHQFEKQIHRGLEAMKDPSSFVVLSFDDSHVNKWLFNVTLKNPTMIFRMPAGEGNAAAPLPAVYTSKLQGSLTASSKPWAEHTTFTFEGDSLGEINLGERFSFKSHGKDRKFNVDFNVYHKRFWYLHAYPSLFEFALKGLKGLGMKTDETLVTTLSDENPLFSSGPAELTVKWDVDEKENVEVELAGKAKDQQFHEELGKLVEILSAYPLLEKIQYDSALKIAFNLKEFKDFAEEAAKNKDSQNPMFPLTLLSSIPDFELKAPKSSAENATGSSKSKMEFSNEKGKELKLEYEGEFRYTDQWRPYFIKVLRVAFKQPAQGPEEPFLKNLADLEGSLEALLPYRDASTVDTLEYKIKVSPKDQEANVKIKYFLNKQGFKLDVKGKGEEMKVNGSLKIYDFEACFNDLAAYSKRVLEALDMKPFIGQVDLYHQVALNLVNQLAEMETDDGVKVAKIEIDVEPKEGKGKIGKQDLKDFMPMMMMFLMPAMMGTPGEAPK